MKQIVIWYERYGMVPALLNPIKYYSLLTCVHLAGKHLPMKNKVTLADPTIVDLSANSVTYRAQLWI